MGIQTSKEEKNKTIIKVSKDLKNILSLSNENQKQWNNEVFIDGHKPVPLDIAIKTMKSICKIIINKNGITKYGTGFFIKIDNSQNYLLTNYHVINKYLINDDITIEIHNKNKMKLNLNKRYIIYLEEQKDITAIEIKESDEIFSNIDFLIYDNNYIHGYDLYKDSEIFTIEYISGKDASYCKL